MKYKIEIGKEYGYLTVLKEVARHKDGHRRYLVRCICGNIEEVQKAKLTRPNCICLECSRQMHHKDMIEARIGMEINGFKVVSEAGKNNYGTTLYKCKCLKCGAIVIKSFGELERAKGNGCINCRPDYHFQINGGTAIGQLRNGTKFIIDTVMIPVVQEHYLKCDGGYILCEEKPYRGVRLHRLLLGLSKDDKFYVDHINRNPRDCRLANLRVVTVQQNNMNRCVQKNNRSGYKGVSYMRFFGCYVARIGINNKYFTVFKSVDPVECASAYNYAADLLFKEFNGFRNDAPEANNDIKRIVQRACRHVMEEAKIATRPVSFMEEKEGA